VRLVPLTTTAAIAMAKVTARGLALEADAERVRLFGSQLEALAALPLVRAIADGEDLAATPWAKFDWPGA
jgi:hypothetical protein